MASDIPYKDFRNYLEKRGCFFEDATGSSHRHVCRLINGKLFTYTFPVVKGRYVKALYLNKVKKALRLSDASDPADKGAK